MPTNRLRVVVEDDEFFYSVSCVSFLLGSVRSIVCFTNLGSLGDTDSFVRDCSIGDGAYLPGLLLPLLRSFSVLVQIQSGVSCASTITSLIIACKREITPVWIIPGFGLIAIGILNAAALLGLKFRINADLSLYAQVISEQAQNEVLNCDVTFNDLMSNAVSYRGLSIFILVLYLIGGSIDLASLSGRHLVSSPWRLPRPFQPFVAKQRSEVMGQRLNVDVSETALVNFEYTGPLSRQFRHDESEWQRSPETTCQVCGNFALQTHAYQL
jgi:hypothetical protein